MGIFIKVEVDKDKCEAPSSRCQECVRVCPVDVFQSEGGEIITMPDNEDECTLCNICVEKCPAKAIKVTKLY